MFIQTEQTPNPATLKFLPGRTVMAKGTAHFSHADSAAASPLAMRLFDIEGVTAVFFGADFVSVTKDDALEWYVLKPSILGALMEHMTAGLPIVEETAAATVPETDDDEVVTQIKDLLDTASARGRDGRRRHHLPRIRGRGGLFADAGRLPGLPKLDRDPQDGGGKPAPALRSRGRAGRGRPVGRLFHPLNTAAGTGRSVRPRR